MFSLKVLHQKLFFWRFHLLLCSLLCVFVVNIFYPVNIYGGMAQALYLPLQMLACFVVFQHKKKILYLLVFIALLLIACKVLDSFFIKNLENELCLLYICFFGSVFFEVLRQIYGSHLKTIQIILAGVSGLILIGYCGFYIFLAIEFHQPGSFSNLQQGISAINDLFYFSYITILTVGYGRITPQTWIAQNATVLVALGAYIYSWIVIATIVGEVMNRKNERNE